MKPFVKREYRTTEQEVIDAFILMVQNTENSSFFDLYRLIYKLNHVMGNRQRFQEFLDRLSRECFKEFVYQKTRDGICSEEIAPLFNNKFTPILSALFQQHRSKEEMFAFIQTLDAVYFQEEFYTTLTPPSLACSTLGDLIQKKGLRPLLDFVRENPELEAVQVIQEILLKMVQDPEERKYRYYCSLRRSVREIIGDQDTKMDDMDLINVVQYLLKHGINISAEDCHRFREYRLRFPDGNDVTAWLKFIDEH